MYLIPSIIVKHFSALSVAGNDKYLLETESVNKYVGEVELDVPHKYSDRRIICYIETTCCPKWDKNNNMNIYLLFNNLSNKTVVAATTVSSTVTTVSSKNVDKS